MNETEMKPMLIYDGDCEFCIKSARYLQGASLYKIQIAPYQEVGMAYPQIPYGDFRASVKFVDEHCNYYSAAEAVYMAVSYNPALIWLIWIYHNNRFFEEKSEKLYKWIADNRPSVSSVVSSIWGEGPLHVEYQNLRWLFLRGLALIYLIAFISLWVQLDGLIGSKGVLPAKPFMDSVAQHFDTQQFGLERYWTLPTLAWISSHDITLHLMCALGVACSVVLLLNIAPAIAAGGAWVLYLSLCVVGQVFMGFQWDALLLEVGFLAIFFAPWNLRPHRATEPPAPRIVLWLYRCLLFRLMFSSGVVKLISGDPSWWGFSALEYHYFTQPIPNAYAWYMHQIPGFFHFLCVGLMFVIELFAPFLIFAPRRVRFFGAAIPLALLQVLILMTGNYAFFNLLTLLLIFLCLDDSALAGLLRPFPPETRLMNFEWRHWVSAAVAFLILVPSVILLLSIYFRPIPRFLFAPCVWAANLRVVNSYGLFAVMTTSRKEIVIEGSNDGRRWRPYEFVYKPGDPRRAPPFVAPHQPRLDWQMWFAALGNYQQNPWLVNMMFRILEGSPAVLEQFANNPFPDKPPRYLRAVLYEYRFTTPGERLETGQYWKVTPLGLYAPVMEKVESAP
ncbi:MAG: lipase maturation factor family protein [Verrucomicrobiae bacterium]|nr:lipase maturation factor family protein [Verrucomicrobiae bacterium]